jgi:uncharacterized membrane protein YfcA
MNPSTPTLAVIGVFLLAGLVQSIAGFGSALVAMPLLALVVDIRTATPLVGIVILAISGILLLLHWRSVHFKDAWQLIVASLLGIPLGLFLLKEAPETIVRGILGAVLIGFGLYSLFTPRLPTLTGTRWLWLSGFVAGILGGAYNTNGPPVVIYGTLRRWSPERFRATLQLYFLSTGVLVAAGQGLAGLWTRAVFRHVPYALPAVAAGTFIGNRLRRHVSHELFNRMVYGLLVLTGVLMFV